MHALVYILPLLFFVTAALYASVGFGGGSTYNAVLILSGADFRIVPIIALACNILVVTGNTIRYAMTGNLDWRALLPALALSVPLAWLGGRVPVNPSGGLECKGHPIGATGLGQVYELVSQLRGECGTRQVEGAKVAIAENGGGLIGIEEAVASVLILAR